MFDSHGDSPRSGGTIGPRIAAIPFRENSDGRLLQLLSERERSQLAQIASPVRLLRGAAIYREGTRADAIYDIAIGVAKTFRTLPDGTRRIAAFLFPDDLLGLAEEGLYVDSAEAVTSITAYRLPLGALENLLRSDPTLEFHILCKLCHELREAQRHVFILGRHRALPKVAMFVQMLARSEQAREEGAAEIYLPMSRSDIADYIGMSLPAVSRAFRVIERLGLVRFRDRRHLRIIDQAGLDSLGAEHRDGDARDRSA
jgi:CRP-like cAMP-binding protein